MVIFPFLKIQSPVPEPFLDAPGVHYVALRGAPVMVDGAGRPVDRLKVLLHDLTYVGQDPDGTYRFLMEGKTKLGTKDPHVFAASSLVPVKFGSRGLALSRLFDGRRVWSYGGFSAGVECLTPRSSTLSGVGSGEAFKINRLYQLARVPTGFSDGSAATVSAFTGHGLPEPEPLSSVDAIYLVVFDMPTGSLVKASNTAWSLQDRQRASMGTSYSQPYKIICGSFLFERLFSINPPDQATLKLLDPKRRLPGNDGANVVRGFTHLQVAWKMGWPLNHIALTDLLKADVWQYFTDIRVDIVSFKGNRALRWEQQ